MKYFPMPIKQNALSIKDLEIGNGKYLAEDWDFSAL